jgi:Snare region anchored in the vesicle membrane C-terminus
MPDKVMKYHSGYRKVLLDCTFTPALLSSSVNCESTRCSTCVNAEVVQNLQAKTRAQLLSGAREVTPLMDVSVDSTASSLIRERNHLQASTTAIDEVLGQAGHVASSMRDQGGMFDNIGNKLATAGAKFPVINGLMNAIRRRKSRDTIMITTVFVVCALFLFWYVFRKWF